MATASLFISSVQKEMQEERELDSGQGTLGEKVCPKMRQKCAKCATHR